jgi:hypothetical protein
MTDTNTSRNIIFLTDLKANDPNLDNYKKFSYLTWKHYAKRHDIDIIVLDTPIVDTEVMRPTWQRWYVYDILESNGIVPNRVALIDIDTMVRWDAPNIFDIVSENSYGAVKDDLSIEWIYNSIMGYKKFFPDVELEWTEYVNNGFLILPKSAGREFCDLVKNFYATNQSELRQMQHQTLKKGTDQTPVNYLAKQFFGHDIHFLSKKFNLTHIYKTDAYISDIYIKCSYVWHFNGMPRDQRANAMENTWEKIKNNYN